jgi:hypothetical protein
VELSCTCPYFEGDGACKHLWAVLLLAEGRGFLRGDGRPVRSVTLADPDDESFDEDLDDRFDDGFEDEPGDESIRPGPPAVRPPTSGIVYTPAARPPARPAWEAALEFVSAAPAALASAVRPLDWPAGRELLYVVDVAASRTAGVTLGLFTRDPAVRGGFRAPKPLSLTRGEAARLPNTADRRALSLLAGARRAGIDAEWAENWDRLPTAVVLRDGQAPLILPDLCSEGRCVVRQEGADGSTFVPLVWDDGPPWQLVLVAGRDGGKDLVVRGVLRRAADERPLAEPDFLTNEGILLMGGRFGRWVGGGSFGWVLALRRAGELRVPASGLSRLFEALAAGAVDCEVELPEDLAVTEADGPPVPHLRLELKPAWAGGPPLALGKLAFAYGPREVAWGAPGGLLLTSAMRLAHRDTNAEAEAAALLERMGFVPTPSVQGRVPAFALDSARLPDAVRELLAAGWRVEAEGRQVRAGGAAKVSVTSGVDWFDLKAEVDFGGLPASLPELLAALRGQKRWVTLGDGSLGLLPEEWLRRHELLAGMGQSGGRADPLSPWPGGPPRRAPRRRARGHVRRGVHQVSRGPRALRGGGPARPAGHVQGAPAPLSARGARLDDGAPRPRIRGLSRRRHGPRQDRAGARPPRRPPGPQTRAVARRRAAFARLQLEGRGRALHAAALRPRLLRPRPRPDGPVEPRPRPDDVRHAEARRDGAEGRRVGLRRPRRGAGRQERRDGDGEGRPPRGANIGSR